MRKVDGFKRLGSWRKKAVFRSRPLEAARQRMACSKLRTPKPEGRVE